MMNAVVLLEAISDVIPKKVDLSVLDLSSLKGPIFISTPKMANRF